MTRPLCVRRYFELKHTVQFTALARQGEVTERDAARQLLHGMKKG